MKNKIILVLVPLFILVFAYFYQTHSDLRDSVNTGESRAKWYLSDVQSWYKKTNRVINPMPYFFLHLLDFLLISLGCIGTIWVILYFFSHQDR